MTGARIETLADGVTLYLGDCRDILPTLPKVDAVVTDPPYGLADKWKGGTSHWPLADNGNGVTWDWKRADNLSEIIVKARHAIIWGGQYYGTDLPAAKGWLVWDKLVRSFSSGHCELAWTTLDQPIRAFNYSHGELATEGKLHPTQKPLPLMRWCLEQLPGDCRTIIDPFMGSGTTGVACARLGLEFVGVERHERYFDIACRRISEALRQPDMFIERPKPAKQEALL